MKIKQQRCQIEFDRLITDLFISDFSTESFGISTRKKYTFVSVLAGTLRVCLIKPEAL
ncbi:hypothetical protein [Methylotuvimicrobium sp. KM2]|uniref:hypothetical protein n=1 Tax=Methylotuvimicrobium sp. KM2 TaxID=3133976 RepID=UPI0031019328